MALFTDFGPSSLNFELNFWINDPPRGLQIMSDIRFMIFREFAKHGIEIPFPQNDLHIRSGLLPDNAESDGFEASRIGSGDRASGSANQALESN